MLRFPPFYTLLQTGALFSIYFSVYVSFLKKCEVQLTLSTIFQFSVKHRLVICIFSCACVTSLEMQSTISVFPGFSPHRETPPRFLSYFSVRLISDFRFPAFFASPRNAALLSIFFCACLTSLEMRPQFFSPFLCLSDFFRNAKYDFCSPALLTSLRNADLFSSVFHVAVIRCLI